MKILCNIITDNKELIEIFHLHAQQTIHLRLSDYC